MLEMLKERKAQLQAEGKKGFTLMEMLIVIAIIAILIAIAIPLFTQQLQAAEDARDEANGRALYAALQADYMLNQLDTVSGNGTATVTYRGTTYSFKTKAEADTSGAPTVTVTLNNNVEITFPANGTS